MCGHKTLPSHKLYFNHNHKSYEEYRVKLEKKKENVFQKKTNYQVTGRNLQKNIKVFLPTTSLALRAESANLSNLF